MRKIFLVTTILSIFSFNSFALSFADGIDFSQYFESGVGYTTNKGVDHNQPSVSFSYGFNFEEILCDFSIQSMKEIFDFTYTNQSWFIKTQYSKRTLTYGLCGNYHVQRYLNYATTNDIMGGICFKIDFKNNSRFTTTTSYGLKSQSIDAIEKYVGSLKSHYLAASLQYEKFWSNGLELSLEMTSHDKFRYALFVSPCYILSIAYNNGPYRINCQTEARICDEFTTAPYIDMVVFRSSLRYTF